MAVSINDLIQWLDANEAKPTGLGGNYTTDELAVIQRCLDAAIDLIEAAYTLPVDDTTWTDDINLAVIMQSTRLFKRRNTPEGVLSFGEFGPIRASGIDADIAALLGPYRTFRFA